MPPARGDRVTNSARCYPRFWAWTTAHEFALDRLVSRIARSASPLFALKKSFSIAFRVSLVTVMDGNNRSSEDLLDSGEIRTVAVRGHSR
jgi:hypothetical protein